MVLIFESHLPSAGGHYPRSRFWRILPQSYYGTTAYVACSLLLQQHPYIPAPIRCLEGILNTDQRIRRDDEI